MPYALYLLDAEQTIDKDKIGAPAGFIYSILQTAPQAIPDGCDGMDVPDGIDYFTHKIIDGAATPYTLDEIAQYFPPPKRWAQYGLPTEPPGFIHGLVSSKTTRPIDLARLEKSGIKEAQVDASVDHWTHKIDETGNVVAYTDDERQQLQPPTLSLIDHIVISLATGVPIDLSAVAPDQLNRINAAISYNNLSLPAFTAASANVAKNLAAQPSVGIKTGG